MKVGIKNNTPSIKMSNTYKFETLQLHVGQEQADASTDARAVPIYATTSYVFENSAQAAGRFGLTEGGNIYTRLMNPTSDVFEKRIAALEGGVAALAVATGSAAIEYAIRNVATAGDHIIADKRIYGGTYNLFAHTFKEIGINTSFVNSLHLDELESAITEKTKAIFIESLGNPNSDATDIAAVAAVAHKHGIPLIVDNTFATPYHIRPIEHGADVVVHSATKFIGGHGTVLGGVIIDSGKFDWTQNDKFPGITAPNPSYHGLVLSEALGNLAYIVKIRITLLRDTGAAISPFNSFLLLQGLETLSLRVERHVENAIKVIDYLAQHPKVARVNHPSQVGQATHEIYKKYYPKNAGSIFTIEIAGSEDDAKKFTEDLELFSLLANVADVKSLVIHPASTTHSQLSSEQLAASGITPQTVRLSIGTEHIDDIIADLSQALDKI